MVEPQKDYIIRYGNIMYYSEKEHDRFTLINKWMKKS